MTETLHEMAVRMVGDRCTLGCAGCPAKALWDKNDICMMRLMAKTENCDAQIEGLRAWAEEHPAPRYPTWREWYDAAFSDGSIFRRFCPSIFGDDYRDCGTVGACDKCQDRPIPADIAAKLGIRPIEEG